MHDTSVHAQHHAPPTSFIWKHVFSLDHKVIGKQYYGMALVAAYIGMFLSWLMRIHLGWTNLAIPGTQLLSASGAPGGVITPEFYLQLMTMHGIVMSSLFFSPRPSRPSATFSFPFRLVRSICRFRAST